MRAVGIVAEELHSHGNSHVRVRLGANEDARRKESLTIAFGGNVRRAPVAWTLVLNNLRNADFKVEIPRRRPDLVAAILTVLRAFIAAGRPGLEQLEPFGRFEDWSNLVRGALVWLGEPDPCGTRSFIAERDPVRADLVTLVAAIESSVGTRKPFVSADLIKLSQERPGLRNALEAIMPRGPSAKGLTSYLSGFDGRIVDGRCIRMSYDKHDKITWFRLEAISASASQTEIPF